MPGCGRELRHDCKKYVMLKKIVLLWMFFGTFGVSIARGEGEQGIRFLDNVAWKQVVSKAVEQKKVIFVDCYTSWCGPCKILAKEVFPLREIGDFFNSNFINVKYDMEKTEGLAFNKTYGEEVENYPTMLVIDPVSGKILHKFVGRRSPEELIFEAKQGLKKQGEVSLEKRYKAGKRDFPFIKDYILSLSLSGQKKRFVEVIDRYFNENDSFDELLKNEKKWKFFSAYLYDFRSDFVQYVIKNNRKFERLPFVNKDELSKQLRFRVLEGANELLKMTLEDGKLVPFRKDPELREMLGKSLTLLPQLAWRENDVAIVKLYDRLVSRDWRGAFELLTYMQVFELERALRGNYWNACAYIAEQSGDRELTVKILESMKQEQALGEKKVPSFNKYDYISFIQKQLGDKDGAKASMKVYKELRAKKDKLLKGNRS